MLAVVIAASTAGIHEARNSLPPFAAPLWLHLYTPHLFDGSPDQIIPGGTSFVFNQGGVNHFQVLGIETSAGLDPTNPLAFPTGLSFVDSGFVNLTMTTLTAPSEVPEPSAWLLLTTSLTGLLGYGWRYRKQVA